MKGSGRKRSLLTMFRLKRLVESYGLTIAMVIGITLINRGAAFDPVNAALLYLLPVLVSAAKWGRGPSILASILGVLFFDVFFVQPYFSLTVEDLKYLISFVVFLIVALTTGTLATKLKVQAEEAQRKERLTDALYRLSRQFVTAPDVEASLIAVREGVRESTGLQVKVILEKSEQTEPQVFPGQRTAVFPMEIEGRLLGQMLVDLTEHSTIDAQQRSLLEAFANLSALALQSAQSSEDAQQARSLIQSEQLRNALFNALSHELKTPLASIIGAVSSMIEEEELFSPKDRQMLLQTIEEGAQRMNRLIGNLLDMARLDSGTLQVRREWWDLEDLLGVSIRRVLLLHGSCNLIVDIERAPMMVCADYGLIEQVLVNLLDNACKYSLSGTEIRIWAGLEQDRVKVMVENQSQEIGEEEQRKIFDKFYRGSNSRQTPGTGLGLSICQAIISAHDGAFWLETNQNFYRFYFELTGSGHSGMEQKRSGGDE